MTTNRVLGTLLAIVAATTVLLVIFNFYFFYKNTSNSLALGPTTAQVTQIMTLINDLGPEQAYNEVVDLAKKSKSGNAHTLGHAYGHAAFLLDVDPAEIFSFCRTELLYGCMHEFVGQLFYRHGLEYITELERLCLNESNIKLYLGCMHGLGHGLVAYAGYNESHLFEIIKHCDDILFGDYTLGCYGGVFMEYNSRDLIDEPARTVSVDDPYHPCVDKGKYTDPCIFWLPLLWAQTLPNANKQTLMDLCTDFPGSIKEKASCYEGVGRTMVAASVEDFAYTAYLCDTIGRVSNDAWLGCRSSAIRDYWSIPEEIDQNTETRCINLSGDKYELCTEYMQEKVDFYNKATNQLLEEREKLSKA